MLDIADQIAYMGPLRWYWELSNERFIQTVKKVLKSMRRTPGYFQKKLGLIQKLNVMMWISKRMDLDNIVDMRVTHKMCRYKSRKEIEDMMKCGKIMSGFCAGDDGENMCIAYGKKKKRVNCVVLRRTGDRDNMINECGMIYVEWKLRKKEVMG